MRFSVLIVFFVVLVSCSKEVPQVSDVIGWGVEAPVQEDWAQPQSRALVEDDLQLQVACTQRNGYEPKKIGVFGTSSLEGSVLVEFNDVDLWWWNKEDVNGWNCSGENRNWRDKAEYVFKAYFPKGEVDLHPSSGAEKLMVVYDAAQEQYDLLVAHKRIMAREENPVVLLMEHPLAALRFDFTIVETGGEDRLLSCWLENCTQEGLYMSSTLNFAMQTVWPQSSPVGAGVKMYWWRPQVPVQMGSSFSAAAYSSAAADADGALYAGNGGWILVVPQQCKGPEHVKFCFTTERGAGQVYSVGIPQVEFKPGYRYSYHVKVSKARPEISLKVTPWNTRKSSYEVDFI